MNGIRKLAGALAIFVAAAAPAFATDINCKGAPNVEEFRYSWRLRGGLRFVAGLMFPTSGVGNLRTTYAAEGAHGVHSELLITSSKGLTGGWYAYESQMDDRGAKTLMTYHGYAWGDRSRKEQTVFDYEKGLARMRKETPEEVENRVKKLPSKDGEFRDILTAIHYLRQNAQSISGPLKTNIYSDGKEYPVIFQPAGRRTFVIQGKTTAARGFEIIDAPGGKKWSGGVKVWLSDDDRRIPFRIEIQQSLASLQLDLQSVEACAFLVAKGTGQGEGG